MKVKVIPVTTGTTGTISESQTVPEQHCWRARNQVTTENSHIGQCTHTAEGTNVKVQKVYHEN